MDAVAIPGGRDVRATLDDDGEATRVVVACPPHPRYGGSRSDQRLVAVSDAFVKCGVACLRIDYGPWDDGVGERRDAANALAWASDRFERVGLFGYSFGAGIALQAAATVEAAVPPDAVSVLAPDADAVDSLDRITSPVQIIYGERDETVNWHPVVERARERGFTVDSLPANHHFVGQTGRVGVLVADFFVAHL